MIKKNCFDKYFEPIDINQWKDLESPYNHASKTKDIFIDPEDQSLWLYKLPTEKRKRKGFRSPWDFWMEIIAYLLGDELGFDIPKTFVATRVKNIHGDKKNTYGSLQKIFKTEQKELKHGDELLATHIPNYLEKKTTAIKKQKRNEYYNFELIMKSFFPHKNTIISKKYPSQKEFLLSFFEMFIFDALIGNLDRHHQNWGLLSDNERNYYQFSPLYDNGRSFRGDLEEKIDIGKSVEHFLNNKESIEKRLVINKRSQHKMFFGISGEQKNLNYYEFIEKLIIRYEIDKDFVIDHKINVILKELANFSVKNFFQKVPKVQLGVFSLTQKRIEFMQYLTDKRLFHLNKVLENLL